MKKLPSDSNPFQKSEPTCIGLDIAVNRTKGLRCVIRTKSTGVWEVVLKFKQDEIKLRPDFPYLDLPQTLDGMSQGFFERTFDLTRHQAKALSVAFNRDACVAIDGPPALAVKGRRRSETIWNEHIIPGIKDRKAGIFWTPTESEISATMTALFTAPDALTTAQATKLGQSLWMFVGFWAHQQCRKALIKTIEVFPDALWKICRDILSGPQGPALNAAHGDWSGKSEVPDFPGTKSESNDAALACFTAWLYTKAKTEELSDGEIVVPRNVERPCKTDPGCH